MSCEPFVNFCRILAVKKGGDWIASAISGKANLAPRILGKGKLKGEIDRQYLSSVKAKRILGWKPKYSLQEGLEITYKWYKEHL